MVDSTRVSVHTGQFPCSAVLLTETRAPHCRQSMAGVLCLAVTHTVGLWVYKSDKLLSRN